MFFGERDLAAEFKGTSKSFRFLLGEHWPEKF